MSSQYPFGTDQPVGKREPIGDCEIDNDWVQKHYPRIHRAAWLMTGQGSEAEDLAQETFVVALDRWGKFERRSSESTWLYGILMRLVQRRGRSLARMRRRWIQYAERLDADAVDSPPALQYVLRARAVYSQQVNSMFDARQLMASSTPTRVAFAVAPDLVISCEIPTDFQEFDLVTMRPTETSAR